MSLLKNRHIAALIMCVMILLGFLLGAAASGRRLYGRVEDIFYNGAKGNGVGIASDLGNRAEAAGNLGTIAVKYIDPRDDMIEDLEDAIDDMNDDDLSNVAEANADLEKAVSRIYDRLGDLDLSQKDAEYRSSLYADFMSYGSTMSHDPYNQAAAEYNSEIRAFPGNIFFALMGYDAAPLFR